MKTALIPSLVFLISFFLSCSSTEIRETKYENGQIKEKFFVTKTKDGSFVNEGVYEKWYQNGQLALKGEYSGGKKINKWVQWYESGKIENEAFFENDSLNGAFKQWYENGQKKAEGVVKMGKKTGQWDQWFEDGKMASRQSYLDNGKLNGNQFFWHENGKKSYEVSYLNGMRDGAWSYWDKAGKLIVERNFRNDIDQNLPAVFHDSKQLKTIELFPDGSYVYTFQEFNSSYNLAWYRRKGKFEITDRFEVFGFNGYDLIKFNSDSIELRDFQNHLIFHRTDKSVLPRNVKINELDESNLAALR